VRYQTDYPLGSDETGHLQSLRKLKMKTHHISKQDSLGIWLLAIAITLGTVGTSFAKNDRNHGREPQGRDQGQGRGYDRDRSHYEAPSGYRYQYRDERQERGAGPEHDFRVGQRLPQGWHQRTYVVDDWRGHYLSAPPRGYHWVQTGSDYVLVAIATGVILQLLLSN
jgi:Ni/Co efflux regulator RcnB